jgi:hypothetical protein
MEMKFFNGRKAEIWTLAIVAFFLMVLYSISQPIDAQTDKPARVSNWMWSERGFGVKIGGLYLPVPVWRDSNNVQANIADSIIVQSGIYTTTTTDTGLDTIDFTQEGLVDFKPGTTPALVSLLVVDSLAALDEDTLLVACPLEISPSGTLIIMKYTTSDSTGTVARPGTKIHFTVKGRRAS